MEDLSERDIWKVVELLRNPMGRAAELKPGRPSPSVTDVQVKERLEAARAEMSRRGFNTEDIATIEAGGGNDIVRRHKLGEYRPSDSDGPVSSPPE